MTRVTVALLIAVFFVASCGTHRRVAAPPRSTGPPPSTVFVSGDGVTAGDGLDDALHQAWPRLVFREAFPPGSILVNGASRSATVDDAITSQLPIASEVHPDTALVWLGTREAAEGNAPDTVERSLVTFFTDLHGDGVRRIVAAGVPSGVSNGNTPAYNAAIARAAADTGARFVDLSDIDANTDTAGNVPSTPALHREVADAFVHALQQP
jgi:hypothetical protein